MEIKLTKKQKFDLLMIYRPLYKSAYPNGKIFDDLDDSIDSNYIDFINEFTLRLSSIYCNNKNEIYKFLDTYKEYIDNKTLEELFYRLCRFGYYNVHNDRNLVKNIAMKYEDWLTKKCWNFISEYILQDDDFVRNYKDKLNWKTLSKHYKITDEFFMEFKDYIDVKNFLKYNTNNARKTAHKLLDYLESNLDNALDYEVKGKRNKNAKKTN